LPGLSWKNMRPANTLPDKLCLRANVILILMIILGDIGEKLGVVDGPIATREYLNMTLSVDHDIIDGAPAPGFIRRLKELIDSEAESFEFLPE
jgi:hypothetical protein